MSKLNAITGATGLVGSHIAEHLAARGERIRALTRASSDTTFLQGLGAELSVGDLHDTASLRRLVAGANVVYHCAARVSDWGPWSQFQTDTIDTTRNLLDACRAENVGRIVYLSSVAVYGRPKVAKGKWVTEDAPLGHNHWWWDHYGRSKVQAEKLVWDYGPNITVVRPSWIYGPRDRVSMPRVIEALRAGKVPIVGKGDNFLNVIYAGDVADGAILAGTHPSALGQAYNLSSAGEVSQVHLLNTMTDALQLPRIQKHVPFWLAFRWAFLSEFFARMFRRRNPPTLTRKAISLVGRPTQFSTEKARTQLGWQPQVPIEEGIQRTLEWYFKRNVAA